MLLSANVVVTLEIARELVSGKKKEPVLDEDVNGFKLLLKQNLEVKCILYFLLYYIVGAKLNF